jgi:DNA-binding NarL/FixJ family response regulator
MKTSGWYDNREWLVMQYIEKGLTLVEVAALAGTSERTIRRLLDKYDIKRKG